MSDGGDPNANHGGAPDLLLEGVLAKLQPSLSRAAHPDRRLGRALAFQVLYESDVARHESAAVFERRHEATLVDGRELGLAAELVNDAARFAQGIVDGVAARRAELDAVIRDRAPMFPLAQMSAVDRNILRIGLFEAFHGGTGVPMRAAINEAVELAKFFGSENSAKFVNGVLGRAAEAHPRRPEEQEAAPGEHAGALTSTTLESESSRSDTSGTQVKEGGETMATSSEERLKKIIAEQLSVGEDEVTPEASFIDDLNADSLDLVELIMALEEEFNVKISDEDAEKIRTVQDAMEYLQEHQA